jgi:Tetracyclin repressor-like, C-terminal domain
LPDTSRRRIGRKSRRIERCFEEVIRAGIADGSMREGADVRLIMLAVLGMLNSVINWRAADQDASVARIAAELSQLAVAGLARPVPARKRT